MEDRYLFRGKCIDDGEWMSGSYYELAGRPLIFKPVFASKKAVYEIDPSTICQCTGLSEQGKTSERKQLQIGTGGRTMGRLIDADAFERSVMCSDAEDMQDVIYALRDYPTAYDPDKVVEQLYGLKKYGNKYDSYWDSSLYQMTEFENKTINDAVEKAIEIVKGGGVDA